MRRKILLTNHYEGVLYDLLNDGKDERFSIKMLDQVNKSELIKEIEDADYLLVSGKLEIDKDVIRCARKLKMVQRTGVGIDRIDLDTLKECDIPLYVNSGVNARSVAEYTIMLMLSCLRRQSVVFRQMNECVWKKQENGILSHELYGKKVGIVGMGNIGRRVAEILKAFQCHVLYYDKYRQNIDVEDELNIHFTDYNELIKESDIISLHCSYSSADGYIIKKEQIDQMKEGVIIINTARGKLIDENALFNGLSSHKIACCGLDTFEKEPLSTESPLREMDNVILSPHIAGLTYESYEVMIKNALSNIKDYNDGNLDRISHLRVV